MNTKFVLGLGLAWQNVADLDVLIKKFSTVQMDSLAISQPCMIQDVTLNVRSLTNPKIFVISSHKTKGSAVPQQTRTGQVELVV